MKYLVVLELLLLTAILSCSDSQNHVGSGGEAYDSWHRYDIEDLEWGERVSSTHYSNGAIKTRTQVKRNGMPHGMHVAWYPDGTLRLRGQYDKGLREGNWVVSKLDGGSFCGFYFVKDVLTGRQAPTWIDSNRECCRLEDTLAEFDAHFDDQGRKAGLWKSRNSSGVVVHAQEFLEGQRHGSQRRWYDSGQPRLEGEWLSGEKDGSWLRFLENGQIEAEEEWATGKKHGTWTGWGEDGQQLLHEVWHDGEMDGEFKEWYADGTPKSEEHWKTGRRHGVVISWYENGQENHRCNWRNGLKHGSETAHFASGSLQEKKFFHEAEPTGVHQTWREDGTPAQRIEYVEGQEFPITTTYDEVGRRRHIGSLDAENRRHGHWRGWYVNGQLRFEGPFKHGVREGLFKWWYESGQLKTRRLESNDKPVGEWLEWHENGQLKKSCQYDAESLCMGQDVSF